MKKNNTIIDSAKKTLRIEAEGVAHLIENLTEDFSTATENILNSKGRVVVTGIGKSANIAQKMVATFNSTGTPAIFMHAADAIHGDLGNVQEDDIVICISKSGDSPEIKVLVPLVKNLGHTLIGMVGNQQSYLAKHSDLILNTDVEKEACPNNLAPTTSTTAQLAMGDALAVALMELRGFTDRDFARYHPGGALGKKLYLKMGDLLSDDQMPKVQHDSSISEAIVEISSKRLGATAVVENNRLVGIITDGDIRRMLQHQPEFQHLSASDIMTKNAIALDADELAVAGFEVMERKSITQILVTKDGEYAGIVHLHDILKEGIY